MSFTHWYDEPPFRKPRYDSPLFDYDLPAIIAEAQRLEREGTSVRVHGDGYLICEGCNERLKDFNNFCPHCGAKINWEK